MAGSSNGARRSADSKIKGVAAPAAAARAPAAVEEPVVHHAQPIAIVVPENQIVLCRYTECNRNHAAAYGRHAVDGCGEFICHVNDPYACLACGCHRSFHKKEPADVNNYRNPAAVANAVAAAARRPVPPAAQPIVAPALPPMRLATPNGVTAAGGSEVVKKGKRTMLTKDQKKKMIAFAEKIGWSSRRQDADEIHDFCDGIGITKRVFVVWLNNNKRNRRNKNGSA